MMMNNHNLHRNHLVKIIINTKIKKIKSKIKNNLPHQ